ncbi:MAG: hypothetical protein LQ347_003734, partial [Umbilicaria vellea]
PSAARPESRDTPPPPDLNPDASTSDAFNAAGRISRRARGSVSYAEPNLRDKMRRPTKELVDAVGADERVPRAASAKPDGSKSENEDASGVDRNKAMRTVVIIKKEDGLSESASWKHLASTEPSKSQNERARAEAASPLGNKTSADLPASVITERRRRTSALHRSDELPLPEEKPLTSGSGATIAALLAAGAGNKKSKSHPSAVPREDPNEKKQLDEPVDIYDFNDSTPTGETGTIVLGKAQPVGPAATRTSRRQPTVLAYSRSTPSIPTIVTEAEAKEAPLVGRPSGRRRETLGSGGAATVLTAPLAPSTVEAKTKSDGILDLKPTKSVMGVGAAFAEGGSGRAERAASRRRSMMI